MGISFSTASNTNGGSSCGNPTNGDDRKITPTTSIATAIPGTVLWIDHVSDRDEGVNVFFRVRFCHSSLFQSTNGCIFACVTAFSDIANDKNTFSGRMATRRVRKMLPAQ